MKFDIVKDQDRLLTLLILTDIVFVFIHIIHKSTVLLPDYLFNIEYDNGYAEIFQYIKEFWIVMLLLFLSIKRSKFLYFSWALLFVYLLGDDAFQVHEKLGSLIGSSMGDYFGRYSRFGLKVKDYGELSVSVFFGILFFVLIAIFHYLSDIAARKFSRNLFFMVALLVFFGVGIDMVHEHHWIVMQRIVYGTIGMLEDTAEMFIMSVITWLVFKHNYTDEKIPDFCEKV